MDADPRETIIVQGDGISASLLVWRRHKRPMPGLAERILAENPGLAAFGPVLPVGVRVVMPVPRPDPRPILPVIDVFA